MKSRLTYLLSLMLAGVLQFMPMVRSMLPSFQALSTPSGGFILQWVAGGVALFGYHAVSSASSISISPATATVGTPYAGTVTYSGGHAGAVLSMSVSNNCLGSYTLAPGLTITYNGGYTASVAGTPSGTAGSLPFTVKVYSGSGCGGSHSDTRSSALTIQSSGSGLSAPAFTVLPQSVVSQVGANIVLSGGATGNPTPQYFWKQGITSIAGATNNSLSIPAGQLTNAGVYTLVASNSQGQANTACYLSMAITPGSNILAFEYTNYVVAGTPVTMSTFITNVPSATYSYQWSFNNSSAGLPATPTLSLTGAQVTPSRSGTYSMNFNSSVGTNVVVNNQSYDSYWMFGYLPVITNQPSSTNVTSGGNATFNLTLAGSSYPVLLLYQNATNLVATVSTLQSNYGPTTVSAVTNVSITLSNVVSANAGAYTVVVTNYWGATTSSVAQLTVGSSLSVSAPQSQTNYVGKNIILAVTPTGTAPFYYQWQKGGLNLSDAGNITGSSSNSISLFPAAVTNSGNYQVVVTNGSGSVTSSVATVSVVPVPALGVTYATGPAISGTGGIPGSPYVVQFSTNLSAGIGWQPLQTNLVGAGGLVSFTDTNTSASVQKFYRLQFP